MFRSKLLLAVVLAVLSFPAHSDESDLQRHMSDQYQGKPSCCVVSMPAIGSAITLRENSQTTHSLATGQWTAS